ncbi:hypothetical protein SHL15_3708 [Streptomyces hygroscopicus subsp. limoneus]|nr:hypothetical protein SHL15_3708 [Streptomyces hygroscopicus subsp. limoneus]
MAISCAIAASAVMFGAPTASAAGYYCDSSGYMSDNTPTHRCTSLSNGVLAHWKAYSGSTNTTVVTAYSKTGGSTISARLGYNMGGSTHYGSTQSISSGSTKSSSWELTGDYYCSSSVGLLSYSDGTYQTPSAHC